MGELEELSRISLEKSSEGSSQANYQQSRKLDATDSTAAKMHEEESFQHDTPLRATTDAMQALLCVQRDPSAHGYHHHADCLFLPRYTKLDFLILMVMEIPYHGGLAVNIFSITNLHRKMVKSFWPSFILKPKLNFDP